MTPTSRPILEALPADVPSAPLLEALPADEPAARPLLEALPARSSTQAIREALPAAAPAPRETNPMMLLLLFFWRIVCAIGSAIEWLFGVVVLMVGLAVLAALPLLQFLSLGYLLEAGGRVARSGRLRDGFIGIRLAARLGALVLGAWLLLLPVRFVSGLAHQAAILDPGGPTARAWRAGLMTLIAVTALVLVGLGALALILCARLRKDTGERPSRGAYAEARDAVWDLVGSLRLPYYFWLGCRGFLGAFAWLAFPITLIALSRLPNLGILAFLGALWLGVVLLYLPFLQMRLAMTNRLAGAFEVSAVRADYKRAPWAFTFAFVVTLLSAIPLHLLKIEMLPRDGAWPACLVFIAFIFPARMLTGWALGRAKRRGEKPRHWFFRITGRLPELPAVVFYVIVVYLSQFTSWNGVWSLYEQHAFLVPVPFFRM